MARFFRVMVLLLIALSCQSQSADSGSLVIIRDPRIDSLMDLHYRISTQYPLIPGWRVQIFFESGNNSKPLAKEAILNFNEAYPEVKAYLLFESPYYKVRVGDFRTKMEAEKFMNEIQGDYPNAFVTRDEINFPDVAGEP